MSKGRTPEMMEHLRCAHCGEFNPSLSDKLAGLATSQYFAHLDGKPQDEWDPEIVELGAELDGSARMLAILEDEVLDMIDFYTKHPQRLGSKQ